MANTRKDYHALLDDVEGTIEQEFRQYVTITVGSATIIVLEEHLREGDMDALLRDLGISSAALLGTTEAIRTSYIRGGQFEAPEARIMFDVRNPRAERWIRDESSRFVTNIVDSQREAIRITLESDMRLGRNPRQTALDIVGRVGRNGRRSGGIVGLSEPQARYVANAREQLLSGDPEQMREYFNRQRRDRRFDGIVRRAIADGRPVPVRDADRLVGRYADRLLALRGESIARTEAITSLNAGREEAVQQAIDSGVIRSDLSVGIWDATSDARTRPSHAFMDGQQRPVGQPFQSSTGALMRYPGDTSMGAGAEDVINCRCFRKVRYDFIADAERAA